MGRKSDYDLLKEIKGGRKESILELYEKYKPLITHNGHKYQNYYEDYIQDAYFSLLDAIKYCDLEKIYSDDWRFYMCFWYFLKIQNIKYYKKINESLDFYEDMCVHNTNLKLEDMVLNKIMMKSFLTKLTKDQRKILQFRRQGKTLEEIGQIFNKTYPWVHWKITKAKKTASEIFLENL